PLDADIKLKAKSFVDVTVDRGAKAVGALLLLVLVKPWGLGLDWQRLSYASLTVMAVWIFMSFRARRGYLAAFRQSIERRNLQPTELRLAGADLSTIETLVQELSHTEPTRVVYAIDMLESLDKASLVTPLLLYHESPQVRARALRAMGEARSEISAGWTPQVRRALGDADAGVRAAALRALGSIAREDAASLARPLLADNDPRIRATAAVALAASTEARDVNAAEATLAEIVLRAGDTSRTARVEVAAALGEIRDPRFQRLLIPLLHDEATEVADQAMESVRRAGLADFIFVPALVSLLRNRHLKGRARTVLVNYGEPVVDALAYFMADESEDPWVRRHIPSTLAMIESQKSVDALTARLSDRDGFLRYKVISAQVRLRQSGTLTFPAPVVEENIVRETRHYYEYLSMLRNLATGGKVTADPLIAAALRQKMQRAKNRIYQLLALVYPPGDIAAAEWTLNYGEPRTRASASEYLDNILTGMIRKMVMPIVEDLPEDERVRRANVLIRTRPRDVEETLLNLINDDDQVISAAAIDMVRQERLWALSADIEHVLAHRDVRDWYVFEAASWALAEQRMAPDRRRALWREAIPAVVLVGQLRHLPLFASVSIDELFRIAAGSRQVRHEAGTTLMVERAIPEMLHVLLDGEVVVTTEGRPVETLQAPSTMGFMEALQSKTSKRTVRTGGIAVTLAITAEELRTQLAYNPELVRGLFASMADRVDASAVTHVFPTGAAAELERFATGGMQPIEKVLAIERVPVFAHISPEEARYLAAITHTVEMKEGTVLFKATDPPSTWLVLSGEVTLSGTPTASPAVARGGDAVGSFGALGGPRIGRDAMVTRAGIALRIDRDELFEILGDRPEMLRQLFEGMVDVSMPAGRTVTQSKMAL
nr:HEAT repeat domain-containing protein [Acidobacteriota bacterium]